MSNRLGTGITISTALTLLAGLSAVARGEVSGEYDITFSVPIQPLK